MRTYLVMTLLLLCAAQSAVAAERVPGCDDLNWSAQVLAANPDIRESCQGVYVRNDKYYARSTIELTRVSPGRVTFKPLHRDGSLGAPRRIRVPGSWRITIEGQNYRPEDLNPGQRLNVYIPEDRFALSIHDGSFDGDEQLINIENPAADAAAGNSETP